MILPAFSLTIHIFYGAELPGHSDPSSVVILPVFSLTSGIFHGAEVQVAFSMGLSYLAMVVPVQW